ncbi:MAG TPA: succinate dehydrogenase, partial [Dehalococcoidia bacterium]|nr:succinate dehydrogenase [Dehalococcoidia bacterium]
VLKDLVVDFEVFWNKIKAVVPWLQPAGPEPEREYIVDNDTMLNLTVTMSCIMCGACVSDCTALAADPSFLGPAALAKGARLVADPRDGHKEDRLRQ